MDKNKAIDLASAVIEKYLNAYDREEDTGDKLFDDACLMREISAVIALRVFEAVRQAYPQSEFSPQDP